MAWQFSPFGVGRKAANACLLSDFAGSGCQDVS
jgi:hypothetical protein